MPKIDWSKPLRTVASQLPVTVLTPDYRHWPFGHATICARVHGVDFDSIIYLTDDGFAVHNPLKQIVENVPVPKAEKMIEVYLYRSSAGHLFASAQNCSKFTPPVELIGKTVVKITEGDGL